MRSGFGIPEPLMSTALALWRLLDHRQRWRLVGLQLLSIVMAIFTVGGIASVVPFFTALANPDIVQHNAILHGIFQRFHFSSETSFLIALGVAFAGMVLLSNVVNLFGQLAINRFAYQVGDTLYVRLLHGYLLRDYSFHLRNNSSVLATKVLHETARVTSGLLHQGLLLVTNVVTVLCVVASIVLLNAPVAVAVFVGLGLIYAVIYASSRGQLLRYGEAAGRHGAERVATVNESLGAIKEILLMQGHELFVQRFARQCRAYSRALVSIFAVSQSPRYILECVTVICLVGVALYFRSRAGAAGPWVAQLSFVGFAAYRLLPLLHQAFTSAVKIRADHPAFVSINADMPRFPPEETPAPSGTEQEMWHGRPRKEICLREVCFHYAANGPAALSNVSLVIPAGSVIGFIGCNGSGKTTLLDLVCGLLAPQSGCIEVDGVTLDTTNWNAWRSTIAYVPQQAFLLDATFAENIALGIPAEQIDIARVETAVRQACLEECVAAFPSGLQERLGERGSRLSGGQRQRLAIARALYRDASLLIMDEATSALDMDAETEIVEMLNTLRGGRTILVVAHRIQSLRYCDLIFELEGGRIVRDGTYGQVLASPSALA
jgi:ABC-type multidrug transport system fused ATPase/permease subunit